MARRVVFDVLRGSCVLGRLAVMLSWSVGDPFAVVLVFPRVGGCLGPRWVVSRELLAAGLEGPAGLGDVQVFPDLVDARCVELVLSSPAGVRVGLRARRRALSEFLGLLPGLHLMSGSGPCPGIRVPGGRGPDARARGKAQSMTARCVTSERALMPGAGAGAIPPGLVAGPVVGPGAGRVVVVSFGFLHGAAPVADITVDVRVHLRDPHVDPGMRRLTGRDAVVRARVLATPGAAGLIAGVVVTAVAFLPAAWAAGRVVRVAIGCAGGRHRSVVIADAVAERLTAAGWDAVTGHRDIGKPVVMREPGGC